MPKKKKLMPTCCECGGTNVETNAWVEYRDDGSQRVVNSEGPIDDESGNWCHDCEANVALDYSGVIGNDIAAESATRLRNEAARENGPTLLDALKAVISGKQRAAYAATQLINRIEGRAS